MQWWGALTNQFAELATTAMKDSAADAAKTLAGSMMKQSFDAAAETLKKARGAPGRAVGRCGQERRPARRPARPKAAAQASAAKRAPRSAPRRGLDAALAVNAPLPARRRAARPTTAARRQAEVVAALARRAAGARAALAARGHRALRVRRPDRLPRAAAGRRAARDRSAGRRGAARSATRSRCRWSRAAPAPASRAARCRTPLGVHAVARQVQPHPRDRSARAHRDACSPACATSRSARPPRRYGLYYAPDPSQPDRLHDRRQRRRELGRRALPQVRPDACTTCCKVRGFTIDGEPVEFGGDALDAPGLDLLALVIGSEGMLAVITEVTVKLLPQAADARAASWPASTTSRKAGDAVAAIIAAGIIPAGLEMMDKPMTRRGRGVRPRRLRPRRRGDPAVRERRHAEEVAEEIAPHGARCCDARRRDAHRRSSASEAERLRFWAGRKNAFPASRPHHRPTTYCMDGTIPRKRLGRHAASRSPTMETKYGLRCANVFHAGDGNLHPLILFDANDAGRSCDRAEAFGAEILELSVAMGGTITGEHGVGVEKIDSDVRAVLAGRARAVARRQARLRSGRPAQPGQGDPDAAPLRRVRPHARQARPARRFPTCRGSDERRRALNPPSRRSSSACATRTHAPAAAHARRRHQGFLRRGAARRRARLRAPARHRRATSRPSWSSPRAAGTPLAELEALLAEHGQCCRSSRRTSAPASTVGGMVAAGLSGPRAPRAGSRARLRARRHAARRHAASCCASAAR